MKKMCVRCGKRPVPKKAYKGEIKLTRFCSICFRQISQMDDGIDDSPASWRDIKRAIKM